MGVARAVEERAGGAPADRGGGVVLAPAGGLEVAPADGGGGVVLAPAGGLEVTPADGGGGVDVAPVAGASQSCLAP